MTPSPSPSSATAPADRTKASTSLAHAVADVNLIEPDLVMTVGDLINGYADDKVWMPQMKQYKKVMGELICPWFPVAGNHDIYWRGPNKPDRELEPEYEMHFGPLWYAFEHKGLLLHRPLYRRARPKDRRT